MNEAAGGRSRSADRERSPSTPSSSQTWLPVKPPLRYPCMSDPQADCQHHHVEMQSSPCRYYGDLFCTSRTSNALGPLADALMTSNGPRSDVVKHGCLGKLERNHRRYFVLRAGSHTGPSRLEWYKNQEQFTEMEKSAGKAAWRGSSKQGVIYLRCCLGVSQGGSSKKGHTVALYAKDQTMVLVVEDQREQKEWCLAIKNLMEEERMDEDHGGGFDEEDHGYCTQPPCIFKEVWPVRVKPRGLGCFKSLAGESRLCLTATSLILIKVAACSDLPSVTMPLLSVRRFGHLDGAFFLELGRSAPDGPGEIWMEARDQGNPAEAQHIHEAVRDTITALRALPDFSRSPTSHHNQLQTLMALKSCRPRYRRNLVNASPVGTALVMSPRNDDVNSSPTKCYLEPDKPHTAEAKTTLSSTSRLGPFGSPRSLMTETGSYMEMNRLRHLTVNKEEESDCGTAAMVTGDRCGTKSQEPGEQQRLGYVTMSPQRRHSTLVQPQDDYMFMASPQKLNCSDYSSPSSSLQSSFISSPSDSYSPLHPSRRLTNELVPPCWPMTSVQQSEAGQSQRSVPCSIRPQDDARQEQTSAEQRRLPAQTAVAAAPVRSVDLSGVAIPFVACGPGHTRPIRASPNSAPGRSSPAASEKSVRRCRLSSWLPSCLQAGN